MSLEAKGSIKYELGAKEPYTLKSPAMGLVQTYKDPVMSVDGLLEELESEVQQAVQQEFARPVKIELIGFSLNAVFDVEGMPNRTLDEFQKQPVKEGAP